MTDILHRPWTCRQHPFDPSGHVWCDGHLIASFRDISIGKYVVKEHNDKVRAWIHPCAGAYPPEDVVPITVSEAMLNESFDDVMDKASLLLGEAYMKSDYGDV